MLNQTPMSQNLGGHQMTTLSVPSSAAAAPATERTASNELVSEAPVTWKWTLIGWFVAVHLLTLAALPFISWTNVVLMLVMWFITGCLGITLGFHRLYSHRSFKTPKTVGWFFALCGTLAFQGGLVEWVARHRMHHAFTETDDDPHNARRGFWYSHMMWLFNTSEKFDSPTRHVSFARDIHRDPVLRFLSNKWTVSFAQIALLLGLGFTMGWSAALWGVFVRLCIGYHCTWFVNSAAHKWGTRRFETSEDSRNSLWVALVTFGEGWHNNHHADQRSCRAGRTWKEFDLTYVIIKGLSFFGLTSDLVAPQPDESVRASWKNPEAEARHLQPS